MFGLGLLFTAGVTQLVYLPLQSFDLLSDGGISH